MTSRNDGLKAGLDIHGVIDAFPKRFSQLSQALVAGGGEVHIVTGIKRSPEIDAFLQTSGIAFTHYFSIVEQLESQGILIDWKENLPYADENAWNNAKRNYCEKEGIDFMFDDSPIYRETFNDISTTYLHVINPDRKIYTTR